MSDPIVPLDASEELRELLEFSINPTVYFTGVRTVIVDGAAHFLFYVEQPSTNGHPDFVVVARLVAPHGRAKLAIDAVAGKLAYGALPDTSARMAGAEGEQRH